MTKKIEKLYENMWKYNNENVGDLFPMDSFCFYNDIWNDWRNDNKIPLVDALLLWNYMMTTDYIDNRDCDSLDIKAVIEQIRLLKKDCDF
jgi:hypothetical protein